jgi:hypothetical protein
VLLHATKNLIWLDNIGIRLDMAVGFVYMFVFGEKIIAFCANDLGKDSMGVEYLQNSLKFLSFNKRRSNFVDLSLSLVLFDFKLAQKLSFRHVGIEERDKLVLFFSLLLGNQTGFMPHSHQLLVELLEFEISVLEKFMSL